MTVSRRYKIKVFQKDNETGREDTIESSMLDDFSMVNYELENLLIGIDQAEQGADKTIISIVDPNQNITYSWALEKQNQ